MGMLLITIIIYSIVYILIIAYISSFSIPTYFFFLSFFLSFCSSIIQLITHKLLRYYPYDVPCTVTTTYYNITAGFEQQMTSFSTIL
eukprot:UN04139